MCDLSDEQCCRERESGLSLPELLITIGLIALILSLLLAAGQSARRAANGIHCASNLRQLGVLFHNYASDYGGYVPRNSAPAGDPVIVDKGQFCWVIVAFQSPPDYFQERDLEKRARRTQILHCPEDAVPNMPTSYVINAFAFEEMPPRPGSRHSLAGLTRLSQVRHPSSVILLVDARDRLSNVRSLDPDLPDDVRDGFYSLWMRDVSHRDDLPYERAPRVSRGRHGWDRINALMFDGSVHPRFASQLDLTDFDDGVRHSRLRAVGIGSVTW